MQQVCRCACAKWWQEGGAVIAVSDLSHLSEFTSYTATEVWKDKSGKYYSSCLHSFPFPPPQKNARLMECFCPSKLQCANDIKSSLLSSVRSRGASDKSLWLSACSFLNEPQHNLHGSSWRATLIWGQIIFTLVGKTSREGGVSDISYQLFLYYFFWQRATILDCRMFYIGTSFTLLKSV